MKNNQSGSVAFRPRARLMKLIGAELISNEVVALVELVKNAHDADATEVTIEFNPAHSPPPSGSTSVLEASTRTSWHMWPQLLETASWLSFPKTRSS